VSRRIAVAGATGVVGRILCEVLTARGDRIVPMSRTTGTDRFRHGYYEGKYAQERLVEAGPVPWTILRTTQFHEFAEQMLHRMRWGRVAIVPRMLLQPVAAREVAQRLADLLALPPSGRARDLAGPAQLWLPEMIRKVVTAAEERVMLIPVTVPGAAGRSMATGGLLPQTGYDAGHICFDDWLGARSFDVGATR
jgi:uncharacterized protein YbjT (DUF2867 family)